MAYTLVLRYNLKDLIKKDDLKTWLNSEEALAMQPLDNKLLTDDSFGMNYLNHRSP